MKKNKQFSIKLGFDSDFFFKLPTGYTSPTYKGFDWNLLWLWFSIRVSGSWKKKYD